MQHSADPNSLDQDANTPLHLAVVQGNITTTRSLLSDHQCNIDVINSSKQTPLDIAISQDDRKLIDVLQHSTQKGPASNEYQRSNPEEKGNFDEGKINGGIFQ